MRPLIDMERFHRAQQWFASIPLTQPKRREIGAALPCDDATLNLTQQCNLKCVGCNRACFLPKPHTPDMTVTQVHFLFDQMDELGIKDRTARLAGGEPTLHKDFAEILKIVVDRSAPDRVVGVFSNQYSKASRTILAKAHAQYPEKLVSDGTKPQAEVFPWESRTTFIRPADVGVEPCPHPCQWMQSFGGCGFGADAVGYTLCPVGGTIDALLRLNSRATSLKQLRDRDFLVWQASQLCSNCGAFMRYPESLADKLYNVEGTPASLSYYNEMFLFRTKEQPVSDAAKCYSAQAKCDPVKPVDAFHDTIISIIRETDLLKVAGLDPTTAATIAKEVWQRTSRMDSVSHAVAKVVEAIDLTAGKYLSRMEAMFKELK